MMRLKVPLHEILTYVFLINSILPVSWFLP